tara:strand:- start:2544 stop:2873 length:330 start_codon:yes stop_codon:yes gene_type:complete
MTRLSSKSVARVRARANERRNCKAVNRDASKGMCVPFLVFLWIKRHRDLGSHTQKKRVIGGNPCTRQKKKKQPRKTPPHLSMFFFLVVWGGDLKANIDKKNTTEVKKTT